MERVHLEDILLDSTYVLETEMTNWNNFVTQILDNNDAKEIDNLLLLFSMLRETTLSSIYVRDIEKIEKATLASFHNYFFLAMITHDTETIKVNGHNVTLNDYKDIIELYLRFSKTYYEYEYENTLDSYIKDAEEGSILKQIFKGKAL